MATAANSPSTERSPGARLAEEMMRPVRVPAWLGSAILHAVIFVLLAVVWQRVAPHGQPGGEPDRPAGIAVVDVRTEKPEYYIDAATPADRTEEARADQPPSPLPQQTVMASATNAPPGLPEVSMQGSLPGPSIGLPDAGTLASAGQPTRGVAGQTTTSVFGASGTGNRFVYVFDRSSSMSDFGGRPLAAAKKQLIGSLQNLKDTNQFQIVFYNERPSVFNPDAPRPPLMMFANEQSKRLAERFVQGITATGGTHHWEALRLALDLRPDVIFFLTDGSENPLTANQLATIERLSERSGTSIHAIEFGGGPPTGRYNFLHRLAERNRGQYVYIDVTGLNP